MALTLLYFFDHATLFCFPDNGDSYAIRLPYDDYSFDELLTIEELGLLETLL